MIAIQEIIDIPASRHISFTLPETVPAGAASVTISVDSEAVKNAALEIAREKEEEATLEELKEQAAARYTAWKDSGVDPLQKWRNSLNGKKLFNGVDGAAYQRSIRDEWPD